MSDDLPDALTAAEAEVERLRYELELITGIRDGLRELREGKGIPHEQVMAELRAMLPDEQRSSSAPE